MGRRRNATVVPCMSDEYSLDQQSVPCLHLQIHTVCWWSIDLLTFCYISSQHICAVFRIGYISLHIIVT
jgi:hypothetical protein